jgi:hypothetical protein
MAPPVLAANANAAGPARIRSRTDRDGGCNEQLPTYEGGGIFLRGKVG